MNEFNKYLLKEIKRIRTLIEETKLEREMLIRELEALQYIKDASESWSSELKERENVLGGHKDD